ncbi:tRNA uridine-5-carboxymethylaminomethyl(34) synthesis GTPase MnmE [Pseudomonadota bacterium]
MPDRETIAAIATPAGAGGIGVVRVSGPGVGLLARAMLGQLPVPRKATCSRIYDSDGEVLDTGIALFFPGPSSYTGEDVLELQGHGGPVVLHMVLERCLSCGARLARPGEFTERAYLNGKLDLAQAEAVADLINSSSEQAVRAAQKSLRGEFSARVLALVEQLTHLRMYVESAIDFPDEEIDFPGQESVLKGLDGILDATSELMASARQGRLLNEGMVVVLAGRPNAGKSSLLNALARIDRAIVSDTPGTTRDTIELHINIDGLPVTLVDTAGLREVDDEVESEGVRRAEKAVRDADLVLYIVDDNRGGTVEHHADIPAAVPYTVVFNKIDLSGRPAGPLDFDGQEALAISAVSGRGLGKLRDHLMRRVGFQEIEGSEFLARTRHLDAIQQAQKHMEEGRRQLTETGAAELLAEELRLAQRSLSGITGEFTSDDLLGRIFSTFCIGK